MSISLSDTVFHVRIAWCKWCAVHLQYSQLDAEAEEVLVRRRCIMHTTFVLLGYDTRVSAVDTVLLFWPSVATGLHTCV